MSNIQKLSMTGADVVKLRREIEAKNLAKCQEYNNRLKEKVIISIQNHLNELANGNKHPIDCCMLCATIDTLEHEILLPETIQELNVELRLMGFEIELDKYEFVDWEYLNTENKKHKYYYRLTFKLSVYYPKKKKWYNWFKKNSE